MASYWLLRAGSGGRYWDEWEKRGIVSIGWDVGDLQQDEEKLTKSVTKRRIEERYSDDPAITAGQIRRFAGVRKDGKNVKPGDKAVILGRKSVLGIATLGEYRYEADGLDVEDTHVYWRDADWIIAPGPIPLADLPAEFRQGGEFSLRCGRTIMTWSGGEEALIHLRETLESTDVTVREEPVFEFDDEAHLQDVLEDRLEQVVRGLTNYEREFANRGGRADFRCETKTEGTVVIETKAGSAGHKAVSQLLAYMQAERQDGESDVRGVLVAPRFKNKTKLAASEADIQLLKARPRVEFIDPL